MTTETINILEEHWLQTGQVLLVTDKKAGHNDGVPYPQRSYWSRVLRESQVCQLSHLLLSATKNKEQMK